MAQYPLALLPVVTISGGLAQLAPEFGAASRSGIVAEAISSWVDQGAAWVHVVDQDAAEGRAEQRQHFGGTGAHVQYAGGVHDDATLGSALASGASRVVLEATDLAWACGAVASHGDRVAVGLDIRAADLIDVALELQHAGCRRFVVTDQAPEHHWKHEDRHLLEEFCSRTSRPVMARGGIRHLSDLHALHELVPLGIDGILLDDALYDGSFTYSEAVSAGADRFDMFFWGPPE